MILTPETPHLDVKGDTYYFKWPETNIAVTLDRIHEDRGNIGAELTVASLGPSQSGFLDSPVRINDLLGPVWKRNVRQDLETRDPDIDWQAILAQVVSIAVQRFRHGSPLINLLDHVPSPRGRWILEPYVECGAPTVFFADGGTGKSTMLLAGLASISSGHPFLDRLPTITGPTLYLDWESDEDTHHERLRALCTGAGVSPNQFRYPVFYRRESSSLPEAAPTLRRYIAEHGIIAVGIDSIGFATMGEEGRVGVVQLYNALRSMNVSAWLNDHIGKGKDVNPNRPYGTIYTHDGARRTFRLDVSQEQGSNSSTIAITNTKHNNTNQFPKHALRAWFEHDHEGRLISVRYTSTNVLDVPELAARSGIKDHIHAVLRQNNGAPLTVRDIQAALEVDLGDNVPSLEVIGATLRRYRDKLFSAVGSGPATTWALTHRESQTA